MVHDIPAIPEPQPADNTTPRFSDMTPEEMDALRVRLGLKLPLPRLMVLASLYQKEKREATDRELKLLDSLLYPLIMQPHNALLAALQTSDAPAADALAGLIEHSRAADGITPQPTAKSAWQVLRHAQEEMGIVPPPPDHASGIRLSMVHGADLAVLPRQGLSSVDSFSIEGTPWHITAALPCPVMADKQVRSGDLYSLIPLPLDNDQQTALSLILTAPAIARDLCLIRYVDGGDYSDVLLSHAQGLEADLSLLVGEDYDAPLPAGYIVCADEETTKQLMWRVREAGLAITTFARATASGRLIITERRTPWLSLPIAPLAGLTRPRVVDVRLNGQTAKRSLPPSRRYDLTDHIILVRTLPLLSALTFTDVCRALEEDITQMKKEPVGINTLRMSVGITEDTTTSQCALWSSVLALWRVLTEQNIPSLPPVFAPANEQSGAITLALIAKRRAIADQSAPTPTELEPVLAPAIEENL
jgi:hypothetical protein